MMKDQLKRTRSDFRLMRSFMLLGMMLLIVLGWYGLRSVEAGAWATKMGMPAPRYGIAAAEINGKLYVVGGANNSGILDTLEVYDPGTNAWTTKRPMPTARIHCAAAVIDGKLYVVGGSPLLAPYNTLEVYDPATDSWASKQGMPTAREKLGAVAINGKLYAVGGFGGNVVGKLNNLEVYDPATNSWTTRQVMPTARYELAASEINGKLYAVGGSGSSITNALEVYDPATNTWTGKQGMPTARYGLAAGVINGIMYAVGGSNISSSESLNTLESYDPATNQWTSQQGMPTARQRLGVAGFGGILYAVGGVTSTTRYNNLEVYDVAAVPEIAVSEPGAGNINDGGSFNFGTTTIGNSVTKTFTITNSGSAPLNLSNLTVPSGFTITTNFGSTTVAGFGAMTTFQITLTASAVSTPSGTLSFNNDDADENPFNFTISGTVNGVPEMNVKGNNNSIASGDTMPSTGDNTDFGTVNIGSSPVTKNFTIENLGSGALSLTGSPKVAISGAAAADFTVTTQPTSPVGTGSSTNFIISFAPGAGGTRTATVSIANDDSNENPYTFAIQGTGRACPTFPATIAAGDVQGLINAITCANTNGAGTNDVINLTAGSTYTLTAVNNDLGGSDAASGLPVIAGSNGTLTINGNGATITRSSAGGTPQFRFFLVNGGANLTVNDLTLSNGSSNAFGGAVRSKGTLTVNRCMLSGNFGVISGALDNDSGGSLIVTFSTINNNIAAGGGGGIYNRGGTAIIVNSTINGNSVTGQGSGGGIYNGSSATATMTVINSTISGNSTSSIAGSGGGGLSNSGGTLTLTNCTITGNSAPGSLGGGGIFTQNNGPTTINNTIFIGNTGNSPTNNNGVFFGSGPFNLNYCLTQAGTGFPEGATIFNAADTSVVLNPTLASNGGATQTHALLPDSPALNMGNNALAVDADNQPLITDQRGTGFTRLIGTVDIGAFEIQCPVINVTNPTVSTGTAGTVFTQNFTQSGGNGNITFSTSSTLPQGLMLSSAGVLSGTPTSPGIFLITVKATDANGCMGTGATYNLVISCPTINVINPATSTGTAGATFNQSFSQTGGAGLTTFSTASTLPNGLMLQSNGTLSGTPTQIGVFPITMKVTDANGCMGTGATYNLMINCQSISVTNPATTTGTLGLPFSQSFTQTGGIGLTTFSTISTLPDGLTLQSNGTLSGTPTQNGVFPITVKAVDSNGCMGTGATYNLNITCMTDPVVTNANDNGAGSLRYAIATACPGSTITFANGLTQVTLTSGELVIDKNLTLAGPGANLLTVRQTATNSRVFLISAGTVNLIGMTITGGNLTFGNETAANAIYGGGVLNFATLTLNRCTVSGNSISHTGQLGASGGGGGIANLGSLLTVINSAILNNVTNRAYGAGISNSSLDPNISNTTNVINSTISGNRSLSNNDGIGGGIFSFTILNVINSTITANQASGNSDGIGGGVCLLGGTANVKNSIIAANSVTGTGQIGPDVSSLFGTGMFRSQGYNLIGNNDSSNGFSNGVNHDQVGTSASPLNAKLGPLADNGGPTQTHALNPDSPAVHAATDVTTLNGAVNNSAMTVVLADVTAFPANIDLVMQIDNEQMLVTGKTGNTLTVVRGFNNTVPVAHSNGAAVNPAFDQRGAGFPRINAGRPDIGAFELDAPPIAFCKDLNLFLNASGTVTVNATDINNGSTDDDGITAIEISRDGTNFASSATYACSDLGMKMATLRVTDTSGQQATCTAMVMIADNLAPTLTCPASRTVECPAAINAGTATATDNCTPAASITISGTRSDNQPLNAPYPLGTTTLTWRAVDGSNNYSTCTQTITVNDNTVPVIQCAKVAAQAANTNASCQATVPDVRGLVRAQSSDTCTAQASLTITQSPQQGSVVSGAGSHPITVTVMDASSNAVTCTVAFTVIDTTPPQMVCPANITTTTATNQCSATVTISTPQAADNCGIQSVSGTRSDNQPLNTPFPKGVTTITWKAVDTSGNQVSCQQTVSVRDAQAPIIQCPSPITMVLPATCPVVATAVVTYAVSASDNCGAVTTLCSPPSGSAFPVGTTTVNCTATDASSNTAACSFTVTIFSGCLQDDASAGSVVLYNAVTGDYRYCCNGQALKAGRGVVTVQGCSVMITHNTTDRRVQIQVDLTTKRGTASLQAPVGTMRCTITDRDVSNNTACAACAASTLP